MAETASRYRIKCNSHILSSFKNREHVLLFCTLNASKFIRFGFVEYPSLDLRQKLQRLILHVTTFCAMTSRLLQMFYSRPQPHLNCIYRQPCGNAPYFSFNAFFQRTNLYVTLSTAVMIGIVFLEIPIHRVIGVSTHSSIKHFFASHRESVRSIQKLPNVRVYFCMHGSTFMRACACALCLCTCVCGSASCSWIG